MNNQTDIKIIGCIEDPICEIRAVDFMYVHSSGLKQEYCVILNCLE